MTKDELLKLYNLPLDELMQIADEYTTNEVEFCSLISARTGKCSQNCKYCAQSSHYMTNIETHPLVSVEEVRNAAEESKKNKAIRFAIVTSGKSPDESDFDKMLEMIKEINKVGGLKSCASLGILNEEQARRLKEAGLNRYHHNINTCRSYHDEICTTHSFDDRINTVKLVKKYGMTLCCGVILGMGETVEQRIEMALELAEIQPDSIPVNFLTPIKGTPFENYLDKIDEDNIVRTLAIFKIANPNAVIRYAGGRQIRLSKKNMEYALKNCVEGILIGNYLTTIGISPEEDIERVAGLGKVLR
jgi:biotin synthase